MKEYSSEVTWAIHEFSDRVFFGLIQDILDVADLTTLRKLLPYISQRLAQARAKYDLPYPSGHSRHFVTGFGFQ